MEHLFSNYEFERFLRTQDETMRSEIDQLGEDYILTVSEADLVTALAEKFELKCPVLGDPLIASHREIEKERSYSDYGRRAQSKVLLTEFILHIPYAGHKGLFLMRPPELHLSPPSANLRSDCLEVVLEFEQADGDQIRRAIDKFVRDVRFHLEQLERLSSQHNSQLPHLAERLVQARKKRILERRNLVASIGIPLRHRDGSSPSYSVPGIRRKPEVRMPRAGHSPFVPEPALADAEYENILTIMRSMVRVMEASPHAFATMKEEDLRQHFLVQLNGQYQGQASGETFNYEGKTDILVREEGRNIFIGECKFWKGPESLTKTIDQILNYLHWRDTKAAIAMFNRNKDFTNVLAQIEGAAKSHQHFKRFIRKDGETEWRFIFANKDDSNREVHLAVMLFDVPKAK